MPRVATLVSHQILVERMMYVQKRSQDTQLQVSSGQKSQDYAGIAFDALRLVNFENQMKVAQRHIDNNTTANLRLNMEETSIKAMDKTVRDFRNALVTFSSLDLKNMTPEKLSSIKNIQENAFASMQSLETSLNVRMEGRYLFGGGKVDVQPVNFPFRTLGDLQTAYPGTGANFPATRANYVSDTSLNASAYGSVAFSASTITVSPPAIAANSTLTMVGMTTVGTDSTLTAAVQSSGGAAGGTGTGAIATDDLNGLTNNNKTIRFQLGTAPATGWTVTKTDTLATDITKMQTALDFAAVDAGGSNGDFIAGWDAARGKFTISLSPSASSAAYTKDLIVSSDPTEAASTTFGELFVPDSAGGSSVTKRFAFPSEGTITTSSAGGFYNGSSSSPYPPVGATFKINSGVNSDVTYTVVANTGSRLTVTPAPRDDVIPATVGVGVVPNVLGHMKVGSTITVAGATTAANNQTYTITGNTGNSLTVTSATAITAEAGAAATTLASVLPNSYYAGDQLSLSHRMDENRNIDLGINASDGAFEKAFRALGMIAQGNLSQATVGRVKVAIGLLNDSLEHSTNLKPEESTSDYTSLSNTIGRNRVLIDDANSRLRDFIGFLDVRVGNIKEANPVQAVAQLNADTTALEISMKAMARIGSLSLAQFL